MSEEINAPTCEQANDLIAFLYGELGDDEKQVFQRHMQGCIPCSDDLAALGGVRRSVIAWRNESLGGISYPAVARYPTAGVFSQEKRSALVAIREFFNLSPLWMKGAVAFATLLFCIFAVLAVGRLRNTPPALLASNPDSKAYSQQQLDALVEQRVQDELQRIKNSRPTPAPQLTVENAPKRIPNRRIGSRGSEVAKNSPGRRPLSRIEREQLAADLRLVSINSDGELELLDDRINQ